MVNLKAATERKGLQLGYREDAMLRPKGHICTNAW